MSHYQTESFGRTGTIEIAGRLCHYSSLAERRWLQEIEPLLISGDIIDFFWQPPPYPITYKYCGILHQDSYRPDASIRFADDEKQTIIEIKRGFMAQKATSKIKRFCQQYPEYQVVLVWFGSFPKKGVAKARLDKLRPHLHHVWQMRMKK